MIINFFTNKATNPLQFQNDGCIRGFFPCSAAIQAGESFTGCAPFSGTSYQTAEPVRMAFEAELFRSFLNTAWGLQRRCRGHALPLDRGNFDAGAPPPVGRPGSRSCILLETERHLRREQVRGSWRFLLRGPDETSARRSLSTPSGDLDRGCLPSRIPSARSAGEAPVPAHQQAGLPLPGDDCLRFNPLRAGCPAG